MDAWMCDHVSGLSSLHIWSLGMEHGWRTTTNVSPMLAPPCSSGVVLDITMRFVSSHGSSGPNERCVTQTGAELWPETCFCEIANPKYPGSIHLFSGSVDDQPGKHYKSSSVKRSSRVLGGQSGDI